MGGQGGRRLKCGASISRVCCYCSLEGQGRLSEHTPPAYRYKVWMTAGQPSLPRCEDRSSLSEHTICNEDKGGANEDKGGALRIYQSAPPSTPEQVPPLGHCLRVTQEGVVLREDVLPTPATQKGGGCAAAASHRAEVAVPVDALPFLVWGGV